MMSLPFGLFTQVSGLGPLGPLVSKYDREVVRVFQIREHHAKIVKLGRYDENIHCDPSLKFSWRDGSDEESQCMFNGKVRKIIPKLFLLPLFNWSTEVPCDCSYHCHLNSVCRI